MKEPRITGGRFSKKERVVKVRYPGLSTVFFHTLAPGETIKTAYYYLSNLNTLTL